MNRYPLLVYPVGHSCNMRCKMCFRGSLENVPHMSLKTMATMILQYNSCPTPREIHWSGGEPTLAGLDFFKRAMDFQAPPTHNLLQTNGTLLDEQWIQFFQQHGWIVSVSYDGLLGGLRGKGDSKALDALRLLSASGVHYSVSCVVSTDNKHIPTRIVDDLKDHTCSVSFIPAKPRYKGEAGYGPSGAEFKLFLERALARVVTQGYQMTIRNFDSAQQAWHGRPLTCEVAETCGYAVVTPDGFVYPCDFFTEGEWWRLGSLHGAPLHDLMECSRMDRFRALKQTPHRTCETCEVREGCGRGCPRSRYLVLGSFMSLDPMCPSHRMVAETTKPK